MAGNVCKKNQRMAYASMGKFVKNRAAKLTSHLKRQPEDLKAKAALAEPAPRHRNGAGKPISKGAATPVPGKGKKG